MDEPNPDPMRELEGIHRALRGIQFTLSAFLFCWIWTKFDSAMWEIRFVVIGFLLVPYYGAWIFSEMVFNARRLKRWW